MVVLNDRAFLGDTLPRIPRDRALALSRNHEYNRRQLTARLARGSILPVNESPGDFKLKVLQQMEEDIDGKAIGEVRVLLTANIDLVPDILINTGSSSGVILETSFPNNPSPSRQEGH